MIYLWVDGEGWKEFELTNTADIVFIKAQHKKSHPEKKVQE